MPSQQCSLAERWGTLVVKTILQRYEALFFPLLLYLFPWFLIFCRLKQLVYFPLWCDQAQRKHAHSTLLVLAVHMFCCQIDHFYYMKIHTSSMQPAIAVPHTNQTPKP
jgi:hypothetical protein